LFVLYKNSGDDTLNSALRALICWSFRTHDPFSIQTRPYATTPIFKPDWPLWRCLC